MGNALFRAVCRTGIFMICAQAVVHFRPHESYEKYLKLLVSVMVLIQLFLPIGSLFSGTKGLSAATQLENFRKSLEQGMEEARQSAEQTDALLEKMTLEEVRRRMEEQADSSRLEQEEMGQDGLDFSSDKAPAEDNTSIGIRDIRVEVDPVEPISGERQQTTP